MLDVERWAELRREHFVRGVSIKELGAPDWLVAQHDPPWRCGPIRRRAMSVSGAAVEVGPVQGGDPRAFARGSEAARGQGPGADRAAGIRWRQDDRG